MKHGVAVLCVGLLAACASLQNKAVLSGESAANSPTAEVQKVIMPQPAAETDASAASNDARGDVADLMRLIHDPGLSEMRTEYNGSYGASLFFWRPEVTYYVALFQGQRFWRVLKVHDEARAEEIYRNFATQTYKLADAEIRRTKLQAQERFLKRAIALSEDRARRLQADLDIAHEQQENVATNQRTTQAQAVALRGQQDEARARLRQIQQQVDQLQNQLEDGLPNSR